MKYIINHSNDTAFNIALEEYAFKHLLDEDQIFLLWINKPSIIVGRHQNTIEEINRDYVRENGIEVVRRISGGGAVYHDLNNLNYTIISKEDENKAFDFKSFSTPVINTLAQLGVKAEFTGRNDLEIDGKKFCGNAHFQKKNWPKSIASRILSLELGTGTMVNHLNLTSVVEPNSLVVRLKSLLTLLNQKSKTSRFMVTSLVLKTLLQ